MVTKNFGDRIQDINASIQFINNPWFQAIFNHDFTREQILTGEIQHYLRVRTNSRFLGNLVASAEEQWDYATFEVARENYRDEICGKRSHSDLMYAMLQEDMGKSDIAQREPTSGTMAALAMLTSASTQFSPLAQLAIFALPELQYGGENGIAAQMYKVLTQDYGFSHQAAITYYVHERADAEHGPKALDYIIERVNAQPKKETEVLRALKYGLVAFNYAWDGSHQAAIGNER